MTNKLLSLWKEAGGKGIVVVNDDNAGIKIAETIIAAMVKSNVKVIVNSNRYHSYKSYFPDKIITTSNIMNPSINAEKYDVLCVLNGDVISDYIFSRILKLKYRFIIVCTSRMDCMSEEVLSALPKIEFVERSFREYNYVVSMNEETAVRYFDIESRMTAILSVFRDYNNIKRCTFGEGSKSAYACRLEFAEDNGWNKDLNTSIPLFAQIEKHYNPDSLYDQASLYARLIVERDKVINRCQDKISAVTSILEVNKNKKFVILARGNEMCDDIAKDARSLRIKIESIHADTPSRELKDENGDWIRVKTGANKGKPKVFGTKLVNDSIVALFNAKKIRALVTTGTLDKSLKIEGVDAIICTSPKATNYYELKSRIANLSFNSDVIVINITFDVTKDLRELKQRQLRLGVDAPSVFDIGEIIL